jgi:hypothetical protein
MPHFFLHLRMRVVCDAQSLGIGEYEWTTGGDTPQQRGAFPNEISPLQLLTQPIRRQEDVQ